MKQTLTDIALPIGAIAAALLIFGVAEVPSFPRRRESSASGSGALDPRLRGDDGSAP